MNTLSDFLRLLRALDHFEVEYVLVGGLAVALHGVTRTTEDIDLFVKNENGNIKNLQDALYSIFKDQKIFQITAHELEQYPVIRYGTPDGYYVDILHKIGETFTFDDLTFDIIESQGTKIRVATIETLISLKKDTLRARDKADVMMLTEKLQNKQ